MQRPREREREMERDAGSQLTEPTRTLCCCLRCSGHPLLFLIAQRALAAAIVYIPLARRSPCNAFGLVALMHVRETALHLDSPSACSETKRSREMKQNQKLLAYFRGLCITHPYPGLWSIVHNNWASSQVPPGRVEQWWRNRCANCIPSHRNIRI